MTAQIPDIFQYDGKTYDLVGLNGGPLYEPSDFGISTQMASTACWRGYQMFYDCINDELILDKMHIRSEDKIVVNGVTPKGSEGTDGAFFFNSIYENLGLKTKFTGSLLLARDFISGMYVHMGFQSPDSYREVLEVHVNDGIITKIDDLSLEMEERRKTGRTAPSQPKSPNEGDVTDWVMDKFSLDYKSK